MSKARDNEKRRGREAAWRDQMDAAAEEAGTMFDSMSSVIQETSGEAIPGHVPVATLAARVATFRKCQHMGLSAMVAAPRSGTAFLNHEVLVCRGCLAETWPSLIEAANEKCDLCGIVPADRFYHEIVIQVGPIVCVGHACAVCKIQSEEAAKSYNI